MVFTVFILLKTLSCLFFSFGLKFMWDIEEKAMNSKSILFIPFSLISYNQQFRVKEINLIIKNVGLENYH